MRRRVDKAPLHTERDTIHIHNASEPTRRRTSWMAARRKHSEKKVLRLYGHSLNQTAVVRAGAMKDAMAKRCGPLPPLHGSEQDFYPVGLDDVLVFFAAVGAAHNLISMSMGASFTTTVQVRHLTLWCLGLLICVLAGCSLLEWKLRYGFPRVQSTYPQRTPIAYGLTFRSGTFFASLLGLLLCLGECLRCFRVVVQSADAPPFPATPFVLALAFSWSSLVACYGRQLHLCPSAFPEDRQCFIEYVSISPLCLLTSGLLCFLYAGCLFIGGWPLHSGGGVFSKTDFWACLFLLSYMAIFAISIQVIAHAASGRLSFAELVIVSQTLATLLAAAIVGVFSETQSIFQGSRPEIVDTVTFLSRFGLCILSLLILHVGFATYRQWRQNRCQSAGGYYNESRWWSALLLCGYFSVVVMVATFDLMGSVVWLLWDNAPTFAFSVRLRVTASWLVGSMICVGTAQILSSDAKRSPLKTIIMRKTFHIALVVALLPPILLRDWTFLTCGIVGGLGALLLAELFRVTKIPWAYAAHSITQFLERYIDDRDRRGIILTHTYLLLGVGVPLVYEYIVAPLCHRPLDVTAATCGIITVGLADSAAALCGYGRHPLPGAYAPKSWEGLSAFFSSALVASVALIHATALSPHPVIPWWPLILSTTAASVFEATTKEVDNYFLPLVALVTYNCASL